MHFTTLVTAEIPEIEENPLLDDCVKEEIEELKKVCSEKNGLYRIMPRIFLEDLLARRTPFGRAVVDAADELLAPFSEQTETPEYLEFFDMTEELQERYETETADCFKTPDGRIVEAGDPVIDYRFVIRDGKVYQRAAGLFHREKRTKKARKLTAMPSYPVKKLYKSYPEYAESRGYFLDEETKKYGYLKAGVMNQGKYESTEIGTPQGGNLSPLLSNIMLNELDKELESRRLRFTRYADDVVIVLKSRAAATRVMYSITDWIERKLGLKVNATKTKVTPPSKLKYLGFGFWKDKEEWKARPHNDSVQKLKRKLKALCKRSWSIDLTHRIKKINEVTRGWINYFRIGSMKAKLHSIDEHLRTQIRVIIWKQWKVPSKREWGLLKLGVPKWIAHKVANWGDHYQFVATKSILARAVSKEKLTKRGLVSLLDYYQKVAHI